MCVSRRRLGRKAGVGARGYPDPGIPFLCTATYGPRFRWNVSGGTVYTATAHATHPQVYGVDQ